MLGFCLELFPTFSLKLTLNMNCTLYFKSVCCSVWCKCFNFVWYVFYLEGKENSSDLKRVVFKDTVVKLSFHKLHELVSNLKWYMAIQFLKFHCVEDYLNIYCKVTSLSSFGLSNIVKIKFYHITLLRLFHVGVEMNNQTYF